MSREKAFHTCHCTSHGARIQFKNWLASIPSSFRSHGGRIANLTQEYNRAIRHCIAGTQFPCGYQSCSRMANIIQKREKVTVYAELAKRKECLVLLVGVKESFLFGHVVPAKMHPTEYVICPYNSMRPEVMDNVIRDGKWTHELVAATCFFFSMKSIQGNQTVNKMHYISRSLNGTAVIYRTDPIPMEYDPSKPTQRRGQGPPLIDEESLKQALLAEYG